MCKETSLDVRLSNFALIKASPAFKALTSVPSIEILSAPLTVSKETSLKYSSGSTNTSKIVLSPTSTSSSFIFKVNSLVEISSLTIILIVSFNEPHFASIIELPSFKAVTTPFESTLATSEFEDENITTSFKFS